MWLNNAYTLIIEPERLVDIAMTRDKSSGDYCQPGYIKIGLVPYAPYITREIKKKKVRRANELFSRDGLTFTNIFPTDREAIRAVVNETTVSLPDSLLLYA